MCLAYETHGLKLPDQQFRIHPDNILSMEMDQSHMTEVTLIHKDINKEEVGNINKGER